MKRGVWLVLCLALAACSNPKEKTSSSGKAKADDSAKTSTSAKASTSGSAAATTSATAASGDEVDVNAIINDESGESSGALDVDLSKAKRDAPSLGGAATKKQPEPVAEGAKLDWLPAGPLEVPNPGWKLEQEKELSMLFSPEKTKPAMVLFTGFRTKEDGLAKVEQLVQAAEFKDVKWRQPKAVTIGPDKIPALVGLATATGGKSNEPGKFFYALIATGGEVNLLAMGGAPDKAGKEALDSTIEIVSNIRKKK